MVGSFDNEYSWDVAQVANSSMVWRHKLRQSPLLITSVGFR